MREGCASERSGERMTTQYQDTCPECGGKPVKQEKRPFGNAWCENGHKWEQKPTRKEIHPPLKIVLPYPHADLSPNSHKHWRYKAKAASEAKETGRILTLAAMAGNRQQLPDGKVSLSIVFHPPDSRKRDDDNALSSFKHYRDGMALALGIDDNRFRVTYEMGEPIKGGKVVVEVGYAPLPFSEVASAQVG
jgi:crossover junction endodeoxyribonuclease RusA